MKRALEEMDHNVIQESLCKDYKANWVIRWKPNPPAASHVGGVWECQICSIQSILTALWQEHGRALDNESLRTLLIKSNVVLSPLHPVILMTWTPSHQTIYLQRNRRLCLHPVISRKLMSTTERDGEGSSIFQMYSGQDGRKNMFICYNNKSSGTAQGEVYRKETWSYSWKIVQHKTAGPCHM